VIDIIGQILWWGMFLIPFIVIPIVWYRSKDPKIWRFIWGLSLSLLISAILFLISWSILLRDGLGPS
jgi:hypothetical protein